jgi:hypothetical protein
MFFVDYASKSWTSYTWSIHEERLSCLTSDRNAWPSQLIKLGWPALSTKLGVVN